LLKQKGCKKTLQKEARARRPGTVFAAAAVYFLLPVAASAARDAPPTSTAHTN